MDDTRAELVAARDAELNAEAHRNAVVRNGGTQAERTAASAAAREAGERYDAALAAYRER